MVISQECVPLAAAGGDSRTGKPEEALCDALIADSHISLIALKISVDLLTDPVPGKQRPRDEHRILEIDLILLIIAVIGELTGTCDREFPLRIGVIAHSEHPDFIAHTVRNIVDGLAVDPLIVRIKYRITRPVAAHALICVRIFADRLPGSGPVVSICVVAQINIAARLIKTIKYVAENTAICAGFGKAVPARMVGNKRAVFR